MTGWQLHDKPPAPPIFLQTDIAPPDNATRVTLIGLKPEHCRWPFGDPREDAFRFCGADKHVESSYCAFHAVMAHQPAQPRRRPTGARAAA